jgi:hypothetical protein
MANALKFGCALCHASFWSGTVGTVQARPIRAQDVHGNKALLTTTNAPAGTRWAGGTTPVDQKPYGFIRNTVVIGSHQPKQVGATIYTNASCSDPTTRFTGCDSMSSYTVGGVY